MSIIRVKLPLPDGIWCIEDMMWLDPKEWEWGWEVGVVT